MSLSHTDTWTNASIPPDTSRTVEMLMVDGEKALGFWYQGEWWRERCENWQPIDVSPAGWREFAIEEQNDV